MKAENWFQLRIAGVVVRAVGDIPIEQSLEYHRTMATVAADVLSERIGQWFGVRMWVD